MAVSAFKSTTKRTALGAGNESDNNAHSGVPFQPSTPVKNKRGHRRAQSFSDFSSRFLSDSNDANSMHLDSLFQQGRRQLASRCQSDCDSESDADSMYSRHTYRSQQNAETGASRNKVALQKPRREDKRRSPSVERSYKEIADFLSLLPDDPLADVVDAAPEVLLLPRDDPTPGNRGVSDAAHAFQSDDPDSVFSRLSRPRRSVDVQSDTESLFSQFSRPRRGVDAQSDTESVFSRLTQPRRRPFDAQSDSESVFSRLTRPRQPSGRGLGPPRTGASSNNAQNGRAKGTRAGALRRSTSQVDLSSGSFRIRDDHSDTESLYSGNTNRGGSGGRHAANFGQINAVPARKKGTRQASLRRSPSQLEFSDNASLEGFRLPACAQDGKDSFRLSSRSQDGKDSFRLSSRSQDGKDAFRLSSRSQQEDEDSPEEAFFGMLSDFSPRAEDTPSGHPEEEKTIRAVHTQNKEPRAQELDAISLYDAMRAEMRKAVSEIRSELEQKSVSKDLVLATPSLGEEGLRSTAPKEDDDDDDDDDETSVSGVRQEYAAKLEQSEKRAQDLWTQLAAEERRCLDLVKFVKELLPAQAGAGLQPALRPAPPPSRSMMQGPEVEQQLVSQNLDADAQRYFDECVSIAGLETISGLDAISVNDASSCGAGYQESESAWSVKDMPFSPRKRSFARAEERNVGLLQPLKIFCTQFEQHGKCIGKSTNLFVRPPVSEDGLVLPWLQWETKLDYSLQEHAGVKGNNLTASSSRSRALSGSQSAAWLDTKHGSKDEQEDTQLFDIPPGVSGLGCLTNGDLSTWRGVDFGHLRNVVDSRFTRIDVEMFVLQRSLMRHSIIGGRIHICGGVRF